MATWTGTTPYATKKQLVSSISGLYEDLQDFQFSTISQVSTLTVSDWLSTPVLYVSDIKGYNIDLSGIIIDSSGVFVTQQISSGTASFGLTIVSTFQFNVTNTVKPSFNITFDLGFGYIIGGALAGLGAIVGGALAGTGAAIGGAATGIATLINPRDQNLINNNFFETINGSTQLQISTLGYDFPYYSTITRFVSSSAPNVVPGKEIFVSTIFAAGTTCIRSVSDPHSIITGDSNVATSTIQSFGQWVALPEAAGVVSTLTNLVLSNTTDEDLLDYERTVLSPNHKAIINGLQWLNIPNDFHFPVNTNPYPYAVESYSNLSRVWYHRDEYFLSNSYISTPWVRFQSTIYDDNLYYITSNISSPAEFTYTGPFSAGNFAICEPDQTGFLSTGTFDFIAQTQNIFVQWGLGVDNLNSTIAAGTAKRVSWDIPGNTSNFIDIPQAVSTIGFENTQQILDFQTNPYEFKFLTLGTGMSPSRIAWDVEAMTFGSTTTLCNTAGYPYQFNSNVYINGTLEAQTIIAVSSIFSISTFVDTQISTQSVIADQVFTPELIGKEGYISSLRSTSNNWFNDYINVLSRTRFAGFDEPLSIVVGTGSNVYDPSVRFDFITSLVDDSMSILSKPTSKVLASFTQSNVVMCNLAVGNLTAGSLVYSNAEAPYITTSTIEFGWTGNFSYGGPVDFSLQQSLTTEPGLFWTNYVAASNQVLNIMAFSNTVNMLAEQFSTPILYVNSELNGQNRDGWASTILYNAQTTPARVYLAPNAGNGEVSLQAQTFNVVAFLNQSQAQSGIGCNVAVPVGNTYKFTSDGSSWTTSCNSPTPGMIQYNNSFQMTMDFENLNLSTTDTLNINAETINLNGVVNAPNLQLGNLYLDGFLSTQTVIASATQGYQTNTVFTGSWNDQGAAQPLNLNYTINSTDFLNIRETLIPSRGFNLFNGYNVNEWNNTVFNVDTTPTAGKNIIIVGNVLEVQGQQPYSGQFWINNDIDPTPLSIPIYQNVEGVLSTIGIVSGGVFARIATTNGTNWTFQNNVPNPQGSGASYSNYYTVAMNSLATTVNSGMPMVYNMPSLVYNTNKTTFYSPMIRVATIDADSFNTREAGMESLLFIEGDVVFTYEPGSDNWYSDSFNPIVNYSSNSYYSIAGWECMINISRIRTDNDIPIGWEVSPTPYPVGGGATDFIWGTARYLQVRTLGPPSASLYQRILMIPKNYFNFFWQGQGPINT